MKIVFKVSEDGKNLVLTEYLKDHNHPISEVYYDYTVKLVLRLFLIGDVVV